ncbi:MAG TPA: phosphate/phosphite/phosphonate ABC transporter substrate-binding protein [Stellaceae bacterium]|nr:phosphate/phosphite/phosphonate ABC transporter substrate-binding protein [Stellaceae bacterium]
MKRHRLCGGATAAAMAALLAGAPAAVAAADCPNNGTVRFGVEPYDTAQKLVPIYQHLGQLIGEKLGCDVQIFVTTSYNAEIEAMRNGKLEAGEFGPLGYVLAHQVAKAEAVATYAAADGTPDNYWASLVTWPGSGIKTVADIRGHSFAFSDPVSTSGHLFPAYGLRKAGLDPDKDIRAIYAGSHASSFEALYNHKVDAGEFNSLQLESATQRGHYKDGDLIFLWKSDPIPLDPITVRGDLLPAFKARFAATLLAVDLSVLSEADRKAMGARGIKMVAQSDAAYDGIRDLVKTLNIDLEKLN